MPPTATAVSITAAEAAKAVKRLVPVIAKDGGPTGDTKSAPVTQDEVLSWTVRGNTVTVVTSDGQKLVGELK